VSFFPPPHHSLPFTWGLSFSSVLFYAESFYKSRFPRRALTCAEGLSKPPFRLRYYLLYNIQHFLPSLRPDRSSFPLLAGVRPPPAIAWRYTAQNFALPSFLLSSLQYPPPSNSRNWMPTPSTVCTQLYYAAPRIGAYFIPFSSQHGWLPLGPFPFFPKGNSLVAAADPLRLVLKHDSLDLSLNEGPFYLFSASMIEFPSPN